jgi:hypothetical protein
VARAPATARPIPEPAPVTTEFRPFNFKTNLFLLIDACYSRLKLIVGPEIGLVNQPPGAKSGVASAGLENEVGVEDGVTRADEPDGMGHAFLEDHMWFVESGHTFQRSSKCIARLGLVCGDELFGHKGLRHDEILPDSKQYVEDLGDIVSQGDVDRLDLRAKWKSPIRDDQGVGVPDTADKGVYGGIKDACLKHATPYLCLQRFLK